MTNYPTANERTLRKSALPAALFPPGRTVFLNDLEASCHGLLALSSQGQLSTYFSSLIVPADLAADANPAAALDASKHYVVAAAGTGLGVGLLISHRGQHIVVPCEYGHSKVPPRGSAQPDAALETKLLEWLSGELYAGKHAIEYEDIVSGRGIVWCYRFLLHAGWAGDASRTAADIAKAAATDDATCKRALQWHYEYLLRCCGQIAIGTQAKGVLLCGDNQFNNGAFIASHIAPLRLAFADTAKHDWLDDVTVLGQKQSLNANLLGCARVAAQCANEGAAW